MLLAFNSLYDPSPIAYSRFDGGSRFYNLAPCLFLISLDTFHNLLAETVDCLQLEKVEWVCAINLDSIDSFFSVTTCYVMNYNRKTASN